ncbi:MAG: transglutaminase domain-containing protein, partial [Planctomycetota bacterium]
EGGRWTLLSPPGADKRRVPLRRSPPPDIEFQFVRQEVRIKAAAAKTVYAIDPAFFVSPERPARGVAATYEPLTRTLRYEVARDANAATTEWSVYSPAGVDLADRVRSRVFSGGPGETRLWRDERRQCLELPPDGLRRLKRLARRVGAGDGTDGPDASAVVERLMSYLSGSGEYSYSIDAHVVPEGIDPVEHFLLDRKEGHCEYFASALALMLRANGVPARLVNGYKGGELNSLSGYYEVEQRHAHAWVEAEVDGRWRTLDPTPSDRRDAVVAANGSTFGLFDDAVSYVTDIWDQYFVLLNLKTQERLFYNPFSTAVASAGAGLGELGESEETASAVGFFAALGRPTEWFAWRGGVIGYAMLAALTVVVVSVLRVRRSGSVAGVRGAASGSSAVAFFERYRSICRDAGLDRPAQATEREFGSVVGDAFDDVATAGRGDGVLRRIIAAFYEARFGGKPLAAERLSTLDEDVHFVGKGLASRMPKDAAAKVR